MWLLVILFRLGLLLISLVLMRLRVVDMCMFCRGVVCSVYFRFCDCVLFVLLMFEKFVEVVNIWMFF